MALSHIHYYHSGMYNGHSYSPTNNRCQHTMHPTCYNRLSLGDPVNDTIMLLLQREIDKDWKDLGRALEISEEELKELEVRKQKDGIEELASQVLHLWKSRDENSVIKQLIECLQYIGRMDLVTKILQKVSAPGTSCDDDYLKSRNARNGYEMTQQRPRGILGWVSQQHQIDLNFGILRKRLMDSYKQLRTTGLPWMNRKIEDCYVELALRKTSLANIFKASESNGKAARILIEGPSGYGKTTLCSKICFDWAVKKAEYMSSFDIVLLLPLRHFTKLENFLEKATDNVLNDDKTLWAVLKDQSKKIFFVLDGFDEINDGCKRDVLLLLQSFALQHITMLVTAKPGCFKSGTKIIESCVSTEYGFPEAWWSQQIHIEGIRQEHKAEFVRKCSKRFIHNSKLFEDNAESSSSTHQIFHTPLFLLLRTAVPVQEREEGNKYQTITELYKALFNYITRRYRKQTSEIEYELNDLFDIQNERNENLAKSVSHLGTIALESLSEETLSFSWEKIKDALDSNHALYDLGFFLKSRPVNDFLREPIHASILEFAVAYHLWKLFYEGKKDKWKACLEICKPKKSSFTSWIIPFLRDLMVENVPDLVEALGISEAEFNEWFQMPNSPL